MELYSAQHERPGVATLVTKITRQAPGELSVCSWEKADKCFKDRGEGPQNWKGAEFILCDYKGRFISSPRL